VRAAAGAIVGSRSNVGVTTDTFERHRSLLFTVAYEMLGSAADAEDVVQETWLRWDGVDHALVLEPRAYLVRIVTRLALNRLRSLARRREDYVGEWLPEPLLTSPDVAADVELAESVSIAMLALLETLRPIDRAVFVLREVFDTPYNEIAAAVGKSPAAVRQIAHRARGDIAARRPRTSVSRMEQERAVDRFLAALRYGDLQGFLDVLAPDVVAVADGGGVAPASRRPIQGADRVARLLIGGLRSLDFEAKVVWLNGSPAVWIDVADQFRGVVNFAVEDSRISHIYAISNPHKLGRLETVTAITRS
jgi:RNA polymerase sigma-70 factor (ECF subfamily)